LRNAKRFLKKTNRWDERVKDLFKQAKQDKEKDRPLSVNDWVEKLWKAPIEKENIDSAESLKVLGGAMND
jgi:hypothetical protein